MLNLKFYRRKVSWCWFSKCYSKLAEKLLTAFTIHFPSKISSESQHVEINKLTHEDNFINSTSFSLIFVICIVFLCMIIIFNHIVVIYIFDSIITLVSGDDDHQKILFVAFLYLSLHLSVWRSGRGFNLESYTIPYRKYAQISTEMQNYHKHKCESMQIYQILEEGIQPLSLHNTV